MADRQAIVLIHGIGEQKPMGTLRGFVETVWSADESIHHEHAPNTVWSKPDSVSENFELRRLTTATNRGGFRSDFFEFYWAHLVTGTKVAHVVSWMKTLLLRSPSRVPRALRLAYWVLWAALIATVLFVVNGVYQGTASEPDSGLHAVISYAVAAVILPAIGGIVRAVVGDAARYLHPAPANIQQRATIRHAGVALLKELHDRKDNKGEPLYDRIIIVGHSLGTVIGYDIIKHFWADVYDDMTVDPAAPTPDAQPLENLAAESDPDIDTVQVRQREYFNELRAAGSRWRISDFVTLGSPLAHGEVLLAEDRDELDNRAEDRELPTCLPVLEELRNGTKQFTYTGSVSTTTDTRTSYTIPNHGAVFGPTRWTNLYFPCKLLVWGDLIAGPVKGILGQGIRDVPVRTDIGMGFLTHTKYWQLPKPGQSAEHIDALRSALDLADDRR